MKRKNQTAAALGRMARGKKKTLSPAQRRALATRLAAARASRWPTPARAAMLAALPALDRAGLGTDTHAGRARRLAARYRRLMAAKGVIA